jgi:hypothetical protein
MQHIVLSWFFWHFALYIETYDAMNIRNVCLLYKHLTDIILGVRILLNVLTT